MYIVIVSGIKILMLTYLLNVLEIEGQSDVYKNVSEKNDSSLQPWLDIPSKLNTWCRFSAVCPEYFKKKQRVGYPCCTGT